MPTVIALDSEIAGKVARGVPGEVERYDGELEDVPHIRQGIEGPRRLLDFCLSRGAAVLVLGVRLGGDRYFAMDAARDLLKLDVAPAVVLVVKRATEKFVTHAWDIGAFSVVDTDQHSNGILPRVIADEAVLARAWREGRAERASFLSLVRVRPELPRRARQSQGRRKAS